jgi:hypothetical protein
MTLTVFCAMWHLRNGYQRKEGHAVIETYVFDRMYNVFPRPLSLVLRKSTWAVQFKCILLSEGYYNEFIKSFIVIKFWFNSNNISVCYHIWFFFTLHSFKYTNILMWHIPFFFTKYSKRFTQHTIYLWRRELQVSAIKDSHHQFRNTRYKKEDVEERNLI